MFFWTFHVFGSKSWAGFWELTKLWDFVDGQAANSRQMEWGNWKCIPQKIWNYVKEFSTSFSLNPFTARACKIYGLKSARAHTHLQTVYFPGPTTNLFSVLFVLMQTLSVSRVMRRKKEKCFRIWNFTLLLVVFKWHHGSERLWIRGCMMFDMHTVIVNGKKGMYCWSGGTQKLPFARTACAICKWGNVHFNDAVSQTKRLKGITSKNGTGLKIQKMCK